MTLDLAKLRERLNSLLLERDFAAKSVSEERKQIKSARAKVRNTKDAQQILQLVAQQVQISAHKRISSIVTSFLKAVFGAGYEFRIDFLRRRGKTEARLLFTKDGQEFDPLFDVGGGVVDVAGLGIRIACLILTKKRRLLVADEPCKHLSKEYSAKLGAFLEKVSKEMGIQMLIVTHNPLLSIGKVMEL